MAQISSDWHPAEVTAEIHKAGSTLRALVEAEGYHKSAGGKALRQPWPRVERIIARFLNRHPKTIWPSRYDERGRPLREGRWPQHSTRRRPPNVQTGRAA